MMTEYRNFINRLPLILKILLAIPLLDGIVYGIYRICRGDLPAVILGVVWIFIGASVGWILDIILLALGKGIWELSDEDISELKSFVNEKDSESRSDDENKN